MRVRSLGKEALKTGSRRYGSYWFTCGSNNNDNYIIAASEQCLSGDKKLLKMKISEHLLNQTLIIHIFKYNLPIRDAL